MADEKRIKSSLAFLGPVLLFISVIQICVSSSSLAQTMPEEAVRLAQDHLDSVISRGTEDPEFFLKWWRLDFIGLHQIEDIADTHLGKPYKRYYTGYKELLPSVDLSDLDSYATFDGYGFPVMHQGRYIGTIVVAYLVNEELAHRLGKERGEFFLSGMEYADQVHDEWLLEARKEYPEEEGYDISLLRVYFGLGRLIVCSKNGKVQGIAPVLEHGAKILSLKPDQDGRYPFISIDQADAMVKSVASKERNLQME